MHHIIFYNIEIVLIKAKAIKTILKWPEVNGLHMICVFSQNEKTLILLISVFSFWDF